jgi:phenylacetate-CoA ligase
MQKLYKHLPVPLQNLACSLYGYKEKRKRYGKWFDHYQEVLNQTDTFDRNKIEEYQTKKLRELIEDAYENVPYYRQVFKERQLKPIDIQSKEDLKKLPILTKEIINANPESFINERFPKKYLIQNKTSGTTGKSLKFYTTKEALSFQWAVWWRHRSRFSFNFGDKHLNFTGKLVVPSNQKKPPYWRWNNAFNQALLNMQSIKKENVVLIVDFINKNNFKYWTGYPSIIHDFCSMIIEQDLELTSKPGAIFFGAENLLDDQKEEISLVTGAILTDQYGFSEGAGNASHCEYSNHHEDFEFGIMECVDPEVLENGDTRGKIICTGFSNHAFPFIRYEVGDVGVWAAPDFECPCGRKSPVLKRIEGRVEDYVLTPEGKKIMRFDYLFKDTTQIKEAQVVQEKLGELTINIVKRENYSDTIESKLKSDIKEWISPSMNVNFKYFIKIPRESNGKFRAVKSLIKN